MITIGLVLKAQGIKGEIKVLPITDDLTRFQNLKEVLIDNASFQVIKADVREPYVFMTLAGVSDRNAAEALKEKEITVRRSDAIKLPEGRFFIEEVLGCEVTVGEDWIGVVKSIDNYGSADVYTVVGERTVRFPLLNDLIESIDVKAKSVRLNAKRFAEVAIYEN